MSLSYDYNIYRTPLVGNLSHLWRSLDSFFTSLIWTWWASLSSAITIGWSDLLSSKHRSLLGIMILSLQAIPFRWRCLVTEIVCLLLIFIYSFLMKFIMDKGFTITGYGKSKRLILQIFFKLTEYCMKLIGNCLFGDTFALSNIYLFHAFPEFLYHQLLLGGI